MTHPDAPFPPDRNSALAALTRFLPQAGRAYAARRNEDHGPGQHRHVSGLSPWIRHRSLTEEEVLQAVLGRHSPEAAEKFIQEVLWRTYWKGWLELRPSVWAQYRAGLLRALDDTATQSGLRDRWEAACKGETGIECFDAWARELTTTGYLHNHARMWFASIWIFTLRLPWELGADFFLRHLLDGDPASNTLGWRWVAGIQTPGKTYLARPDNIAKFTQGRFATPKGLATVALPLEAPPPPPIRALPAPDTPDPSLRTGFLVTPDDLSPHLLAECGIAPDASATISHRAQISPLEVSPAVLDFEGRLLADMRARWTGRLGDLTPITALADWVAAHGLEQIVTHWTPTGPEATALAGLRDVRVVQLRRGYDSRAWPRATHGFFRFRAHIPDLIAALGQP